MVQAVQLRDWTSQSELVLAQTGSDFSELDLTLALAVSGPDMTVSRICLVRTSHDFGWDGRQKRL